MKKIQLKMLGFAQLPGNFDTYLMILIEIEGNRALTMSVGALEAKAVAIALENVHTIRPMTHDLIKTIIYAADLVLKEVLLCDLKEDTYFARLIFEDDIEVDCRPSDAIAIAIRCNVPIFINEDILEAVGVERQVDKVEDILKNKIPFYDTINEENKILRIEILKQKLDNAIKNEEYEEAARIRDELNHIISGN